MRLPKSLQELTLTVIGIGLFVSLFVLGASIYFFIDSNNEQTWETRQSETTQNGESLVSDFLARADNQLSVIDTLITFESEQGEPEHALAVIDQLVEEDDSIQELIVLDANGIPLAVAAEGESSLVNPFTIPLSNWFLQAKSGETYLSELQFSATNQPYIIFAKPLQSGGVVAALLEMNVLSEVVSGLEIGETGETYLINTEGQVISHQDFSVVESNTRLDDRAEFETILEAEENDWTGVYENFQETRVLGATLGVPETDWIIVTEVDYDEAFGSRQQVQLYLGAGLLALWFVLLYATYIFLRQLIFVPVEALRVGAEEVQKGKFDHHVPVKRDDEIGHVSEAFNQMVKRLAEQTEELRKNRDQALEAKQIAEENSRLKSEFLSTMSHEMRTPMNAIEGFTTIILNGMAGDMTPKARMMLERVSANSQRLLSLINDFLDLSRIESGRLELVSIPIHPAKMAEKWQAQMQVLAEQKAIGFEVDVDPTLPETVHGDEEAITKIAVNLLGNAFKFTKEGKVGLKLTNKDPYWLIEVSDTGIGIPPHARDYIFDEFRQVDGTSRREFGGTGLGLAIVQKLTRHMGGTITLASEVGKGSTFTVTLPHNQEEITEKL